MIAQTVDAAEARLARVRLHPEARPVPQGACRCADARSFTAKNASAMAARNAPAARLPAMRHCPAANTQTATTKATGIHDVADRLRRSSANQIAGSSRTSTSISQRNTAMDHTFRRCRPFEVTTNRRRQKASARLPLALSMTLLRVRYGDASGKALAPRRQPPAPLPACPVSDASVSSASATT